jgi:hypothetical protein
MRFQQDTARAAVIRLLACAAGLDRLAADIVGAKSATLPALRPRGQGAEALELLCRYAWPGNAHRTHLTKPHF